MSMFSRSITACCFFENNEPSKNKKQLNSLSEMEKKETLNVKRNVPNQRDYKK